MFVCKWLNTFRGRETEREVEEEEEEEEEEEAGVQRDLIRIISGRGSGVLRRDLVTEQVQ